MSEAVKTPHVVLVESMEDPLKVALFVTSDDSTSVQVTSNRICTNVRDL